MSGEGRVSHVGEVTRVKFRLHRVTKQMLRELNVPFTIRQLRLNADGEESQLVKALLGKRAHEGAKVAVAHA